MVSKMLLRRICNNNLNAANQYHFVRVFVHVCVHLCERQRDRETERERDRETERQRDRETEKQRVRGTVCVRVCVKERERERERMDLSKRRSAWHRSKFNVVKLVVKNRFSFCLKFCYIIENDYVLLNFELYLSVTSNIFTQM